MWLWGNTARVCSWPLGTVRTTRDRTRTWRKTARDLWIHRKGLQSTARHHEDHNRTQKNTARDCSRPQGTARTTRGQQMSSRDLRETMRSTRRMTFTCSVWQRSKTLPQFLNAMSIVLNLKNNVPKP